METRENMVLSGTLRLSDSDQWRTKGKFNALVRENANIFERFFGAALFPGSLNVDVPEPTSIQADFDAGKPTPSIVIPKHLLKNMPAYIGDGQAWSCNLMSNKFPEPIVCWIFRRIGSLVPPGVIEIVARDELRQRYDLRHADPVKIAIVPKQS